MIKTPTNPLPWSEDGAYPEKQTIYCIENNRDVCTYYGDKEYILQACNNFPKAIELLEGLTVLGAANKEAAYVKVKEFLNSLNAPKEL